ncbi:MAG: TIGR01777 family oxidoreductase [Chloroflexi bacterium]|nr:TIGR01777 family oxidoreductase [Chloroflexota bacterium]
MKVAITGSSGLIGSALTRHLRETGHEVVEMRRGARSDARAVWNPEEGWIREGALDGIDAVVNLGGASIGGGRWTEARKQVLRDSRIAATRALVDQLRAYGIRPAAFVQGSGVDVYGGRGDERLEESAGPGDTFLAQLVIDWEAEARRAEELGARVVFARTSFVVDREASAFKRLILPIKFGVGGPLGGGRQWFPWVHLEDEVRALAFLLTADISGPVNIAAPETVTNAGITKALGSALKRPTLFPVPGIALKLLLGEMAQVLLLDSKRIVPRVLAEAGFEWSYPTVDSAVREATGKAPPSRVALND